MARPFVVRDEELPRIGEMNRFMGKRRIAGETGYSLKAVETALRRYYLWYPEELANRVKSVRRYGR